MSPALPASERLPLLDTVRGFALLGILIMNMPGFGSSFFAEADGSHLWPSRVDQVAEQLRDALFSGKFNSMFSLLFGLGFTLQFQRMQALAPEGATTLYLRRLIVLLAFGLASAEARRAESLIGGLGIGAVATGRPEGRPRRRSCWLT